MSEAPPEKARRRVPPAERKARNDARQRKIVANSSDKAFRKGAPFIKAKANRKLRRTVDAALRHDPLAISTADVDVELRLRDRHWGTENAAIRRAAMAEERAWLDSNPVVDRRGRSRHGWEVVRRHLGLDESWTQARYLREVIAPRIGKAQR